MRLECQKIAFGPTDLCVCVCKIVPRTQTLLDVATRRACRTDRESEKREEWGGRSTSWKEDARKLSRRGCGHHRDVAVPCHRPGPWCSAAETGNGCQGGSTRGLVAEIVGVVWRAGSRSGARQDCPRHLEQVPARPPARLCCWSLPSPRQCAVSLRFPTSRSFAAAIESSHYPERLKRVIFVNSGALPALSALLPARASVRLRLILQHADGSSRRCSSRFLVFRRVPNLLFVGCTTDAEQVFFCEFWLWFKTAIAPSVLVSGRKPLP